MKVTITKKAAEILGVTDLVTSAEVVEFLRESNYIEEVLDDDSVNTAITAWRFLLKQDALTLNNIQQCHGILMAGKLEPEKTGVWRKQPVYIGGKEAKQWFAIPGLMESWIKDAMTSVKVPGDNGENIRLDHIQFEAIHPFIDGNGRMGRILLNWERVKAGLPILIIKESERWDYYKWFSEK